MPCMAEGEGVAADIFRSESCGAKVKGLFQSGSGIVQNVHGCAGGHGDPVKVREPVLRDPANDHTLWSPCISIQRHECSPTSAGVVQHGLRALFPQ
jgi:hypothetical protein